MEQRMIGSLPVSVVGLGCNNFGMRIDEAATASVVAAAVDAGITLFDTADSYGGTKSEQWLGDALGKLGQRDKVVVATKFASKLDDEHPGGASPAWVRQAVDDSLRRLGVDHIDLYQLHRPDADTPIADTLGALDEIVKAGKVREIGCSNFSADQLREAEKAAEGGARFVSVQNEFNLLKRADEPSVLPACADLGVGYIPYFPLASGLLSGKYTKGEPPAEGTRLAAWSRFIGDLTSDENFDTVARLTDWASDHGHSVLDLAVAWLAAKQAVVSVIAGATSPDQVRANAAAAGWRLTAEEVAEVDALAAPVP